MNSENSAQSKPVPLDCALGLSWQTAGITTLEPFVMRANDWLFCVVAADMDKNIVRLNCEAIGEGAIYWVGTLEQLFTEFYRP